MDENEAVFSGTVENLLGSQQKGAIITEWLRDGRTIMAFGDSDGDIGMLSLADRAYCVQPTPALREEAATKGWMIIDQPNLPVLES